MLADTCAPLVLTRCCGLAAGVMDSLHAEETARLVRSALDLQETAAVLAPELADALYRTVPDERLPKPVRRAALRLRRDVHNGRYGPSAEKAAADVRAGLDRNGQNLLARWAGLMRSAAELLASAEEVSGTELEATRRSLITHLCDERILGGLALASPGFAEALRDEQQQGFAWDSRLARSAVAYLSRAAVKPSPFSTLATVGLGGWGPQTPPGGQADAPASFVSSARAVALELLRSWAVSPFAPKQLPLVANPGIRRVGDRTLAANPLYVCMQGVFARVDEVTDYALLGALLDRFPTEPRTATDLAEDFGIDAVEIRRLVAMGVLLPVAPWSLPEGRHFSSFAAWLGDVEGPAADAVRELAALEDEHPGSDPAIAREKRGGSALRAGFAALRRRPADWMESAAVFHEVVAHAAGRAPQLDDETRTEFAGLADVLRPRLRRSALYDRLLHWLESRHGAGTKVDLLAFCYDALGSMAPGQETQLGREVGDPCELGGDRTLAGPFSTVFFQVTANERLLVVNRAHLGMAGLIARWAAISDLRDGLEPVMESWITGRHPGCRVYQTSAHADWIDFQRPVLTRLPFAGWGAELATGSGTNTDLRGFMVEVDPLTRTLQLTDSSGAPAALSYLGVVPTAILRGIDRLLTAISDPWLMTAMDPPTDQRHRPRLQRGRTVLRRAQWRFTTEELPAVGRGTSPVELLTAVEKWRREQALPQEVFVSQTSRRTGRAVRKPQWVGFASPHAILAAWRGIETQGETVVRFTEALPDSTQHGRGDRGAVATEYIGLVRHA